MIGGIFQSRFSPSVILERIDYYEMSKLQQ